MPRITGTQKIHMGDYDPDIAQTVKQEVARQTAPGQNLNSAKGDAGEMRVEYELPTPEDVLAAVKADLDASDHPSVPDDPDAYQVSSIDLTRTNPVVTIQFIDS